MRISRRAILLIAAAQLVLGLAAHAGAASTAGQRYLVHVSGMT